MANIGIATALPAYTVDPAFTARRAEELGFESLWYAEHPVMPVHSTSPFPGSPDGVIPDTYSHFTDPYIALARASGVTTTLKLGTGITLITERNPLVLAKTIAALDMYSGGRFLFGIGTGWHREETEMFGGDFDHRWNAGARGRPRPQRALDAGRGGVSRQILRLPARALLPQARARPASARAAGRHGEKRPAPRCPLGRRLAAQPRYPSAHKPGARRTGRARRRIRPPTPPPSP